MSKSLRLAILGATGAVGETALNILAHRKLPISQLYPLASKGGRQVVFGQQTLEVIAAEDFNFQNADIAIFSAGSDISRHYAPLAAQAGCMVVDNTACFRYEADVPLVVPEVNVTELQKPNPRRIIANPNCSTIQMLVALKPIYDRVGITRINVATYQAVSGTGLPAMLELQNQLKAYFNQQRITPEVYRCPIAFNVIPEIDVYQDNGYTKEEMKMHWETQKILGDTRIQVNATAVRVPVLNGHSEAIHIETRDKISVDEVRTILREAPGVVVVDDANHKSPPPTVRVHADGQDAVFVGRIREDFSHPRGLNLWCVSDNLRKGAALNAIQIVEYLIEQQLY